MGTHLNECPTCVQYDPGQHGIFISVPMRPDLIPQVSERPTQIDLFICPCNEMRDCCRVGKNTFLFQELTLLEYP